jgi:predicted amino acid dehydrogenase
MDCSFALIVHPANIGKVQEYIEWCQPGHRKLNPQLLAKIFDWTPAYLANRIEEVTSATGARRAGLIIAATILPETFSQKPKSAVRKTLEACRLADEQGAKITALGGLTSLAGYLAPEKLQRENKGHFTTGNTFTVALALQQLKELSQELGLPCGELDLTILGGSGDIGGTLAEFMANDFRSITITGRSQEKLRHLAERIKNRRGVEVRLAEDNQRAVAEADVVIAATSSTEAILSPHDFKPGAIVSDIGYPKNIGELTRERQDIIVYLGGICQSERPVDFGYGIDLPRRDLLYGCFAEALILDFEEDYRHFSMGRGNITEDNVAYLLERGLKHGYRPAPPFQHDHFLEVTEMRRIVAHNSKLH